MIRRRGLFTMKQVFSYDVTNTQKNTVALDLKKTSQRISD